MYVDSIITQPSFHHLIRSSHYYTWGLLGQPTSTVEIFNRRVKTTETTFFGSTTHLYPDRSSSAIEREYTRLEVEAGLESGAEPFSIIMRSAMYEEKNEIEEALMLTGIVGSIGSMWKTASMFCSLLLVIYGAAAGQVPPASGASSKTRSASRSRNYST